MAVTADVAVELLTTPATLAGLTPRAWYRPEELVADYAAKGDATVITRWRDATTNGYDLTGVSAPVFYSDDDTIGWWYPLAWFDGTNDYLSKANLSDWLGTNGVGTVYVLGRAMPTNAGSFWSQIRTSPANGCALTAGSTLVARNYDGDNPSDDAVLSQDLRTNTPGRGAYKVHLWEHSVSAGKVYAGASCATSGLDDAGLQEAVTDPTESLTDSIYVGATSGGTYFAGAIVEVIVFNTAHTQAQRRQVMRYFRRKYGLMETEDLTGSDWTEIPDVRAANGVQFTYGLDGVGIENRVAGTGTLKFVVMNSAGNSAGYQGYYSPGHTNHWEPFDIGAEVRVKIGYGGKNYYKWRGYIDSLDIIPGIYGEQLVGVNCVDWMDMAAEAQISGIALQKNKRSDEIMNSILARMNTVPPSFAPGYGSDVYPAALDNSESEALSVMTEFQRIAQSELGFVYMAGDQDRGGQLVFEPRMQRGTMTGDPELVLSDAPTGDEQKYLNLSSSYGRDDIVNEALVQLYPRKTDTGAYKDLFVLQDEPQLLRGTSQTFFGPFRDPNSGRYTRVGADSIQTPASGTDYKFYTGAGATGTDISSQITVTIAAAASGVSITVFNNGPLDGYLNLLKVRGYGVYAGESILFMAQDNDSQNSFGRRTTRFDMPYQSDPLIGIDVAYYILNQGSTAQQRLKGVTFLANYTDALMSAALEYEISSKVGVEETVTAISSDYFVNAISFDVSGSGLIRVSWALAPANTDAYWILQVDGFTELGDTTRLSYGLFSPLWQLNVAALGVGTYLNP